MKVLYFSSFRENLGMSEETIDLPVEIKTVSGLLKILQARGNKWLSTLSTDKSILVAVNQEMANKETKINKGDEVAFFPPVTGG